MLNRFIFAAILFPLIIYSQKGIKGSIINQNNKPLEFVEVLLLSMDTIVLKSDITDMNGNFLIESLNGVYIIQVKQLGNILKTQFINLCDFIALVQFKMKKN